MSIHKKILNIYFSCLHVSVCPVHGTLLYICLHVSVSVCDWFPLCPDKAPLCRSVHLCPAQRDVTRRKVTAAWCELSHRRFWLFAIFVSCTVPILGYKNMGHGATFSFNLIWNIFSLILFIYSFLLSIVEIAVCEIFSYACQIGVN